MSFVSRLRMANMFPVRSDLGNARIEEPDENDDELYNIIRAGKKLAMFNRGMDSGNTPMGPTGIRAIGDRMRGGNASPILNEPKRFGGVVGGQSNPGADILNRSSKSAERIYEGYKQPLNKEVEGPSRDEMHLERYFDRQNKAKMADAATANAGNKGWKTATVTDPNDPSKQISVRVNETTGETQPLNIDGVITRTSSAKDIQTGIDNKNKDALRQEGNRAKAQGSLDLLNELLGPDNNLTTEAARAVGKSSIGNFLPTTLGYSGSTKINKLKNERVLDLLKDLKEQSRTGATGMGNMSNKDLAVLEKAASMLDTGLDEETFKNELIRIKDILTRGIQDNTTMKPSVSHNNAPQAPEGFEYVRRPDNKGWTAVKKIGGK